VTTITKNSSYTLAQFTYDSLGRRTAISRSPSDQLASKSFSNLAYAYAPPPASLSYSANGLNQYSAVSGTSYSYDGRGNLISDGVRAFTYDLDNHLLTGSAPTPVSLAYDPLGRLQTSTASGATTNFLYDGSMLVAEYDNSGNILNRYVPGPGVDEPAVWYAGSGTSGRRWLHADDNGSIIAWSDSTANPQATYGYDPFGQPSSAWSGSRYSYTGQLMIPEAHLYNYKARVYDPGLGRFLQTDPVGYASDINAYAYVHGDPVNGTDPSGEVDPAPTPVDEIVVTPLPTGPGATTCFGCSYFLPPGITESAIPPAVSPPIIITPSAPKSPPPSGVRLVPVTMQTPQSNGCSLVSPTGRFGVGSGADARFNPQTAAMLSQALGNLNQQGIVPVITSGYRSPALQNALRSNPGLGALTPAPVSWHSAGAAVDFGPNSNAGNLGAIQAAMAQAGFVWGGSFRTPDARHYQSQPAGTSPSSAMVQACARAGG
jgi:RHS repeat-associated protein